jgi:hypothetical protein
MKKINMKKLTGLVLWVFFTTLTFGQFLKYDDFKWDDIPFASYNLEQYGEEDFIILASENCMEFQYNSNTYELEFFLSVHKKYLALTDNALSEVNTISIPLVNGASIIDMNARYMTSEGKVTEITKNRIKTIDSGENSMKEKVFAIEGASVPGIVEYYYIVKQPVIVDGIYFCQWQAPAYNVSFELNCPKNLHFMFQTYNNIPPVNEMYLQCPNQNCYRFFIDSVPAMPLEKMALKNANYKRIAFSIAYNKANNITRLRSLDDAARFIYNVFMDFNRKESKLLSSLVKKINLNNLNEEEKIRKIELWVKTNIHPVSASNRAKDLEFILKNHVATDDGFTRLLLGLYRMANVPFELVYTCDKNKYYFDPEFDAWNYLEEALLYFPNVNQYIKPDEFHCRLGYIPTRYQNNYGLFLKTVRIDDEKTFKQFTRLIEPVPLISNMDTMYIKTSIATDENRIKYHITRLIYGSAMLFQSYYDSQNEERKKKIQEIFVQFGDNAKIENCIVKNVAQKDVGVKPFYLEAEVYTDLVNVANDKYIVQIGELIGSQSELYNEGKRTQPIDVTFLHGYYRLIEFAIPEGYRCEDISPLNMDITLDDGTGISARFTSNAQIENNVIKVEIDEYYNKMEYPVEIFDAFKAVINAAADFNKVSIVLEKI